MHVTLSEVEGRANWNGASTSLSLTKLNGYKKSFVKVLNFDKALKILEPQNLCSFGPFYKKSFSETPSLILMSDILISNSKPTF